jgi:hypothetical protein
VLSWLDGAFATAAGFLEESVRIHRESQESSARTEAAYWLARVRIQSRQKDVIAQYEEELRTLGGLPQSVAWFVDLLWRARLPDRAQQVWKTVRANPRIAGCDESFLIDARFHLHCGELERAGLCLANAEPRGGVLRVERLLYLALTKLKRHRLNEAAEFIHQAERGPYPASALQKWRRLLPPSPKTGQPPSDVEPGAWRLHQASLAISRGDPASALRWVEKAGSPNPDSACRVETALPGLHALARSQKLAEAVRFTNHQTEVSPGLLTGLASCLEREGEGRAALDAAEHGDTASAHSLLQALACRVDLPPDTAHHLALVYQRGALGAEDDDPACSDKLWRLAWRCRLRWAESATVKDRSLILDCLLTEHRRAIKESLARNAVDAARRHWQRVMDLAGHAILAKRIDDFRDELVTEYLVLTRESMRYGKVPAGYDADYETGLNCLTRLLSLDSDNPRLLIEVVSICTEWFHECYGIGDMRTLAQIVERFTPFALNLGRRIEQSDAAELTARSVLAEFTKFRGFICDDPVRKADLYREAQRWHPTRGRSKTETFP